jgi:transposase-like protein
MTKKQFVLAGISAGIDLKELARKYNVPYSTCASWKRKHENEQDVTNDIAVLVKTDEYALKEIAEAVKETAPAEVCAKIDKVVAGVIGLQELEPKFHAVVFKLLESAETLADNEKLSVKDWRDISAGIGTLYASIFNKNAMSVNVVNQTTVNNEQLSMFKGSMKS